MPSSRVDLLQNETSEWRHDRRVEDSRADGGGTFPARKIHRSPRCAMPERHGEPPCRTLPLKPAGEPGELHSQELWWSRTNALKAPLHAAEPLARRHFLRAERRAFPHSHVPATPRQSARVPDSSSCRVGLQL